MNGHVTDAAIEGASRRTTRRAVAVGITVLVYLVTVGVFGAGLWLILAFGGILAVVFGLVLMLITVMIGPRPALLDRRATVVAPDAAPTLYGIAGRVAGELKVRRPWRVAVDGGFGATVVRVGPFGRRVVIVGLPLWTILEHGERDAVLARCLADESSGELRRSALVSAALHSMYQLFGALNEPAHGMALGSKGGVAANPLIGFGRQPGTEASAALLDRTGRGMMKVFAIPVRWLIRWQESLLTADSARARRLANRRCAEVVGAGATGRVLDKSALGEAAMNQLRASVLRGEQDPLAWVCAWYEGLSDDERSAIVARGEPDGGSQTALAGLTAEGTFAVPVPEWVAVDGELEPLLAPVRKDIHDWAVEPRS